MAEQKNKPGCSPEDIALKSFFLGPQSENAVWSHELILHLFKQWYSWRKNLYAEDGRAITEEDQLSDLFTERKALFRRELDTLIDRFQNEVPSFSPRYIGHMVTEISLPALLGHIITLLHNPNNISGEASRVGLKIEKEALNALFEMVGMDHEKGSGHFTSGGTVANIEAALRARGRLAKWLAVGAIAKEKGIFEGSVCEAAGMGWVKYDQLRNEIEAEPEMIRSYHFVRNNPWAVAGKYKRIFGKDFLGPVMLIPSNKHYSWNKASEITGIGAEGFWPVETDEMGKLCVDDLQRQLENAKKASRPVMMVVSVGGTTELGEFDPVDKVQDTLDRWKEVTGQEIWHHVDMAYGGFFCSMMNMPSTPDLELNVLHALQAVRRTNSVTIDPHKLGYVPYASGAFLCRRRREYQYSKINAPYIDFNEGFDPGPQTLEGSRSAAGAVSTWLTSRVIGFDAAGYGRILERSVASARLLADLLRKAHPGIHVNPAGESNIITFCVAVDGEPVSETNKRSLRIYDAFSPRENNEFVVSKTSLEWETYSNLLNNYITGWNAQKDAGHLILIRLVLMNPFFDTKETDVSYPDLFVENLLRILKDEKIAEPA